MTISVWILGDQLIPEHPVFERAKAQCRTEDIRVLMIESDARVRRYQYASNKLVFLFSAMRHYAQFLRDQEIIVDYRIAKEMTSAIDAHLEDYQPDSMVLMSASSIRGQEYQRNLKNRIGIPLEILPNSMFLSNCYDPFPQIGKQKNVRQESFYREMRRHYKLLMDEDGEPLGGSWNFDKQNRKKLPDEVEIPEWIRFEPDEITREVMKSVRERFPWTESVENLDLAVTHQEAEQAAVDFFQHRLTHFGTYEDAMTQRNNLLFHSMLSPYLNLGLLDPLDLAKRAEEQYHTGEIEINNVEGFIRQVVGWREYMHWQYQRLMPELAEGNYFHSRRPLPEFFWSGETDMNCLKHVIRRALKDGYVHHIERLMLLSNYCLLAGIKPFEVLAWFQSVFIDAYDWVMIPNVMGMGLYADGGTVGTKPYISSANYINRMGDYCKNCVYDHSQRTGEMACPFNFLYWNFLLEHEDLLRENNRMARMLYNLKHLDEEERQAARKEAEKQTNNK
jgi:deoxyribodipyrimidine photolyase-related protein